ncbi:MAG: hypothetical protein AB1Z57_10490 [Acidimicrobiia bacterium]
MAGDSLIDAYLAELDERLGRMPDRRSALDEVADHLWEKVDRLVAMGRHPADAQRDALFEFGSSDLVGRAFASAAHGGAAVPTRFTKAAGWAGVAAGSVTVLFAARAALEMVGAQTPLTVRDPWDEILAAVTVLVVASIALALAGLGVRYGSMRRGIITGALFLAPFLFALAAGLFPSPPNGDFLRVPLTLLGAAAFAGSLLSPWFAGRAASAVPLLAAGVLVAVTGTFAAFDWAADWMWPASFGAVGIAIVMASYRLAREAPVDRPDDLAIA